MHKHVQYFLGTLRQDNELADTNRITLSNYQLTVGSSELFLNQSIKHYSFLDLQSRTTFLWHISNELKLTYQIENVYIPNPSRQDDTAIMDFLIQKEVSPECLQIMNACRLYLQVYYISDIVTADGKQIAKWASHPERRQPQKSSLSWPYQVYPSESKWKTWRLTLLKFLRIRTDYNNNWYLKHRL